MTAFGSTWPVFLLFTVGVVGLAAFMTGHAIAATWRPTWQVVPYALLLGLADRFFVFALFHGALPSVPGFVLDTVALGGIALVACRLTMARKLVRQYPWLYERAGVFRVRRKAG